MKEFQFSLPQLTATTLCAAADTSSALLLAGGRTPTNEWLQALAKHNPQIKVFCADGGVIAALAAELKPALLLGDADSATSEIYQRAEATGVQVILYPTAKDATDLQLLLRKIPAQPLLVSGIWGGRCDHLYSNIFSLLKWQNEQQVPLLLADEQEAMLLLRAAESYCVQIKSPCNLTALSLLPLTATAVASIEGVRWPLEKATLQQLEPYAVSNLLASDATSFSVTCHAGALGAYLYFTLEA